MTTPNYVLDPWFAWHTTADQQNAALAELVRRIIAGEVTAGCTPTNEPAVDQDTKLRPRGGKSSAAVRAERAPVRYGPFDEMGYDKAEHYDVSQDGRF